jgi:hypothetical protein
MAQDFSLRLLISEKHVRSQVSQCEICDKQSNIQTVNELLFGWCKTVLKFRQLFLRVLQYFPVRIIPPYFKRIFHSSITGTKLF